MLGILFIYIVGNQFYALARANEKNKWLFAILGIISFYAGSIIFVLGITIFRIKFLLRLDGFEFAALSIVLGGITCRGTYKYLQNRWTSAPKTITAIDILDDDFITRN